MVNICIRKLCCWYPTVDRWSMITQNLFIRNARFLVSDLWRQPHPNQTERKKEETRSRWKCTFVVCCADVSFFSRIAVIRSDNLIFYRDRWDVSFTYICNAMTWCGNRNSSGFCFDCNKFYFASAAKTKRCCTSSACTQWLCFFALLVFSWAASWSRQHKCECARVSLQCANVCLCIGPYRPYLHRQ